MNAILQEFLERKKQEQREKELKQREAHLASLGLVEVRGEIFLDSWDGCGGTVWDSEIQKYRKINKKAIEITDEEYQELLKYAPIPQKVEVKTNWAGTIATVATVMIFLSVLGGLLFLFLTGDVLYLVFAVVYCVLWFPILMGFSKIVAAAEKKL